MASRLATIDEGGKIFVPADLLRELELRDEDSVVLQAVEVELRVRSRDAVIAKIQNSSGGTFPIMSAWSTN